MPAPEVEPSGSSPSVGATHPPDGPTSRSRTRSEPNWVRGFIAALGVCGNVTRAAKLAGVDVSGPYNRRNRYPEFREEWVAAIAAREARAAGVGEGGEGPLHHPADGPPPRDKLGEEYSVSGAGVRRLAEARWSDAAEEAFLTELSATANVRRAAEAAGFSAAGIYRRKARERLFSEKWEAAMAVGKARLESFLMVQAERNLDPEAMPIAEGDPKVGVSEAISILKHKPAAAADRGPREAEDWTEEVEAARERILMRLRRLRAQVERERKAAGWTQYGEDWNPPGWVKA